MVRSCERSRLNGALQLGVQGFELGAVFGHLTQRGLLMENVDLEVGDALLAGDQLVRKSRLFSSEADR